MLGKFEPFILKGLPITDELFVGEEVADPELPKVFDLPIHRLECGLYGLATGEVAPLVFACRAIQAGQDPAVHLVGNGDALEEQHNLGFKIAKGDRRVSTPHKLLSGAAIVHKGQARGFGVFLRGDRATAACASDHAREGEAPHLWAGELRSSEKPLYPLEFVERDHRLVLALMGHTLPLYDACVERVRKHFVDGAQGKRPTSLPFPFLRAEAPLVRRDVQNLARRIRAGEHELPHSPHERKTFRVGNDGPQFRLVKVSCGRLAGKPSVLQLRAEAPPDVLREIVDVVLGVSENDRQHELALRRILKRKCGKTQVLELALVEHVDDAAAVNRVAGEAVWMPGDNAVGFAFFDPLEHRVEDRPARTSGTHGFLKYLDNRDIRPR